MANSRLDRMRRPGRWRRRPSLGLDNVLPVDIWLRRPCAPSGPSWRPWAPLPSRAASVPALPGQVNVHAPLPSRAAFAPWWQSGANPGSRPLDVAPSREAVKRRRRRRSDWTASSRPKHSLPCQLDPCSATPGTDASEATCKPSSVPPLSRRGRSSIWDAGCPAPRAADPRAGRRTPSETRRSGSRIALLFGLAPGRACPFHPAQPAFADLPVRHCGAGPRLTADGCYPLPCVEELGLSSCRQRVAPTWHATIRSPRWQARF